MDRNTFLKTILLAPGLAAGFNGWLAGTIEKLMI